MRWANGSSVLLGGYRPFCLRPPSFAGSCSTNRTYTTKSTGLSRWRTGWRWKLSGELVSEATLAAEAGLLDIRERRWCADLFEELGVRSIGSVPIESAGTAIGLVRPEVADRTGIPAGVPVVLSPADTQCGLLGLGVAHAEQVGIVAGWSIPLLMLTDTPVFDGGRRIWTGCYVDEALWSLESTCGDAGNSYRWLADTMWAGEARPFARMDTASGDAPVGSDGVLGFLGGVTDGHEQDRYAGRRFHLPRAHDVQRRRAWPPDEDKPLSP